MLGNFKTDGWPSHQCSQIRRPITAWGDETVSVNMKWVVQGDVNGVNPGEGWDQRGLKHINQSVCVCAHNS